MKIRALAKEFFSRYAQENGWFFAGVHDFSTPKERGLEIWCANVILTFPGKWISPDEPVSGRVLRVDLIQGGESAKICHFTYGGYAEVLFRFEFRFEFFNHEMGELDFREYILENLLETMYIVEIE